MYKTNGFLQVKNTFFPIILLQKRLMELSTIVRILDSIAPLSLAETWDNVGLLVEAKTRKVDTILLTNDLTKIVLSEALENKSDLIVSYHPPIFVALKSLTTKNWKHSLLLQCIQSNISIYSPHTALDAFTGGVNDWLISCFALNGTKPIQQTFSYNTNFTHCINVKIPVESFLDQTLDHISGILLTTSTIDNGKVAKILVNGSSLVKVMEALSCNPSTLEAVEIYKLEMNPLPGTGMGRIGNLNKPITIGEALDILKGHVGVKQLRVALGTDHTLDSTIKKVAVCAGSGASILQQANADLFITGEMSHHELLNATHKHTTVILCEHSNSERGFLHQYAKILKERLQGVKILISENDRDPITIM